MRRVALAAQPVGLEGVPASASDQAVAVVSDPRNESLDPLH